MKIRNYIFIEINEYKYQKNKICIENVIYWLVLFGNF